MSNKKEVKNKEELISIKVTMVGNVGVGKTCIVKRLVKNEYDESGKSTVGANYSKYEIYLDNKKIILDIWDTAGQEKFRSMGRHFYKNSNIVVIVYDITKKESFDDIKTFWYDNIKENAEKYKVIGIVGNKYDLFDKEGVEIIDDNVVKEFVDKIKSDEDSKIISMNVSALNGYNIKMLFNDLVKQYLEKEFNILIQNNILEKGNTVNLGKNKEKKNKCC
jgi:small GTP-binding protein